MRHRLDHELGQRPDERVDAVGRKTGDGAIEVAREPAHLVFERRERADVEGFALFVQCGHRGDGEDSIAV